MTKIRAFGEPRLDAALDSILLASAPTQAERPPVTRRFQKRAVGVAVLALCAGLGVAQWRAQSNGGADTRKVRYIAIAPYESLYPKDGEAEPAEPVAVAEPEPPKPAPPAPARDKRTPTPSTVFYDKGDRPSPPAAHSSAGSKPDFTPERGAGPRGTARFTETPDDSRMTLATMGGIAPPETGRPVKRKAPPPKGPRHIRQFRHPD